MSMINIESALSGNIFYALLASFVAGILTSFTPCIFPMIPITLSILGHDAEKNSRLQNFTRSLIYVLGIAITYSILGVSAAMTGNLFGQTLSNKYIVGAMSILFFLMALSMWGFFEIQVPAFIRNRLGVGKKQGYWGIFTMGLISGIVASPCVGPVLVAILSHVSTTKNIYYGFILLFTYALGLGLIFLVIGLFSQALSLLPRSGAWMNRIKFILGALLMLTSLYYARLLIPTNNESNIVNSSWQKYSLEMINQAKDTHTPVMIDFRADWCAACLELEEKTFSHTEFKELSRDFILLKVDATEETPENQKIIDQYEVKGLPTVVFLNRNGAVSKHLTFTQFIEWTELKPKMTEALK